MSVTVITASKEVVVSEGTAWFVEPNNGSLHIKNSEHKAVASFAANMWIGVLKN